MGRKDNLVSLRERRVNSVSFDVPRRRRQTFMALRTSQVSTSVTSHDIIQQSASQYTCKVMSPSQRVYPLSIIAAVKSFPG